MAREAQYINWSSFEYWEKKIKWSNDQLLSKLQDIQKIINDTAGLYESDAAESIRGKINGMENRFKEYYNVVDNFKIFMTNVGEEVKAMEQTVKSNADQFI
ncbi:MAG: hypothetical protein HFG71_10145 [Hungatella sp.]|jgi:hypothetical protein|nr:hypothetical protein [Hungatella sp.]